MLHVPEELVNAQNLLKSKRKLCLILRSKAITLNFITIGDLADVYMKHSHQKRGKWVEPNEALFVDADAQSITYPGKHDEISTAALNDISVSIKNGSLARLLQSQC